MLRLIDRFIIGLGVPSAVLLLLVVMAGVVFRAIDNPLSWTDEASGYLMVWCACFGWMGATRKGAHIRINFFMNRLPGAASRIVRMVFEGALFLLGAIIAYKAVHLVNTNLDIEATSMPISAALLYIPLIPAGLLMMMQAVIDGLAICKQQAVAEDGIKS